MVFQRRGQSGRQVRIQLSTLQTTIVRSGKASAISERLSTGDIAIALPHENSFAFPRQAARAIDRVVVYHDHVLVRPSVVSRSRHLSSKLRPLVFGRYARNVMLDEVGADKDVQWVQASESSRCPCYDVVRALLYAAVIFAPRADSGYEYLPGGIVGFAGEYSSSNHGRRHAAHIFIRFNEGADWRAVRQRIARFASSVTSAWDQITDIREGTQDRLFMGLVSQSPGMIFFTSPRRGSLPNLKEECAAPRTGSV